MGKENKDMTKAKDTQYCVTALNRLTMKRDVVTPPCSYDKAKEVLKNYRKQSGKDIPYLCPRIAEYHPIGLTD